MTRIVSFSNGPPLAFNILQSLMEPSSLTTNFALILPGKLSVEERKWEVRDPFGDTMDVYREVSNDIEMRVMQLILELRRLANHK